LCLPLIPYPYGPGADVRIHAHLGDPGSIIHMTPATADRLIFCVSPWAGSNYLIG